MKSITYSITAIDLTSLMLPLNKKKSFKMHLGQWGHKWTAETHHHEHPGLSCASLVSS